MRSSEPAKVERRNRKRQTAGSWMLNGGTVKGRRQVMDAERRNHKRQVSEPVNVFVVADRAQKWYS